MLKPVGGLLTLALCVVCTAMPHAGANEADAARDVLKAFGRDTGLCVVLGCGREGSAGLLAELAAQSRMLAHGLAFDAQGLERARAAIEAKGLPGRAMAEHVALKPLPYVNDLVDLAVIEDPQGLAAQGVSMDEVLRVVAPEGAVCVKEGAAWKATRKPRPKEMDEWTHVRRGPDDNMVSTDRLARFPMGLRWIDGLPKNLNRWASVRGWVLAGGRCFALSATEVENLNKARKTHYLVARNAYNGLPLWKLDCETTDDGAALYWQNAGPLVADAKRVYAVKKDKAIGVDAATGEIAATFDTKYAPARMLLLNGVLVTVCWEGRDVSKSPLLQGSLWATWVSKNSTGTVEAFDAATGTRKWTLPVGAHTALGAGESVFVLGQTGNPPTAQEVIGVDLQSGKERWRVPHAKLGAEADLQLSVAGPGYVVVTRRKCGSVAVLGEQDGRVLWEDKVVPKADAKPGVTSWLWTPVVDGQVWLRGQRRDPLTGEAKGKMPTWVPGQGCTPSVLVGNLITQSRGCTYNEFPETSDGKTKARTIAFKAARGACMQGMVPAYGMFYTAQNNCVCAPGQILGFLAFGPNGAELAEKDFEQPRPIEQGPAFGKVEGDEGSPSEWPLYRGNAARTGANKAAVPGTLKIAWQAQLNKYASGPLAAAWQARLEQVLNAPVAAGGLVVTAGSEDGTVYAREAATGKAAWRALLGGRIDSAPTLYKGYCFVGCRDGWLYALRAKDGALAWRTRVAPVERRMVAHGQVESIWPAIGSALVHDGVLYANAGRGSESDGGVAALALDPATGRALWSKPVGVGALNRNDLLRAEDGALCWNLTKLDPKTGQPPEAPAKPAYCDPLLDGRLARYGFRMNRTNIQATRETTDYRGGGAMAAYPNTPREDRKPHPALWTAKLPQGATVLAVALGAERVVAAGTVNDKPGGFAWVLDAKDGRVLGETALPAAPVYDGLALTEGRVYLTLQDGQLVALDAAQ